MQTAHDQWVAHSATLAAERVEAHQSYYRMLGMALASSVSAGFWVAVLAVVLPALDIAPTESALFLTALGICGVVSTALFTLTSRA